MLPLVTDARYFARNVFVRATVRLERPRWGVDVVAKSVEYRNLLFCPPPEGGWFSLVHLILPKYKGTPLYNTVAGKV